MRHLIQHAALLIILSFGLIHPANGGQFRSDEVSESVMREGCYPLVSSMCPAKMNCWVDLRYPKYGSCTCNKNWSLKSKPPTPLEPGSELAKVPHKSDCVPVGRINIVPFAFHLGCSVTQMFILVGALTMLRAIIKNGGFKANSSCIALLGCILVAFGWGLLDLLYCIQRLDLDPDGTLFYIFYNIFQGMGILGCYVMMFESSITWLDLWRKSVEMTKKTASYVTVIRYLLRLLTVGSTAIYLLMFMDVVDQSKYWLLTNNVLQFTLAVCCLLFAPLLGRVLCKNMKDVTNPNRKAASAIRITGFYAGLCPLAFNISFRLISPLTLYTLTPQHIQQTANIGFATSTLVNLWAWYQYLQFAHRRYLGDTLPASRLSQYLGFTTLGLKGSTASTRSSVTSSMASESSSTQSVAVTSSAEGEESDTKTKGTMA